MSIGNLVAGGTGKTPFLIELLKRHPEAFVVSRGYGRKTKGVQVVSLRGECFLDAKRAGDEPLLIAKQSPRASVIVSENREKGILKAIELGAKAIFLDDGFRFGYKKFDILLRPKLEPLFDFCLPSGAYREPKSLYAKSDITACEGVEYIRTVTVENPTPRMVLLTAIANPSRLDAYLPDIVGKVTYKDHALFEEEALRAILEQHHATSLLVTQKDAIKMEGFALPLSVLVLTLWIEPTILEAVDRHLQG